MKKDRLTPDLFAEPAPIKPAAEPPGDAPPSVSIAWYANKQREYYEAGLESATAWHEARGVKWP